MNVLVDKGIKGEYLTYKYLKSLKGHQRYLFNLYLPKDDKGTTELDVVLLHESGIYVFESKNYSGWIFGTETQKNWVQTLPQGKGKVKKQYFYNPIMQNKGHIKWLKSYILMEDVSIYSCIVFSNRCTLKDINLTSGEHVVINRYDILKTVEKNVAKNGKILTIAEIENLYSKLYPLTQVNEMTKNAHIQAIQNKKHEEKREVIHNEPLQESLKKENFCPQCGAKLVERMAGKGKYQGKIFLGCSDYPKCKYMKNI